MTADTRTIKDQPPRWFLHAQTFERAGVFEYPGVEAHPTILSFFEYTTLKGNKLAMSDETAWCSAFVCAMMEQTGIKSTKSAAARSWMAWGEACPEPWKLGAIVVCKRVDPKNPKAAHVGFFAGYMPEKHAIALLGGNQSNKICTKLEPVSNILAVRYPIGEK